MTGKLKVLVTGATGQQGGSVARALLERGHHVRALTRKPSSDAARALAKAGAEVVTGDFTAAETVQAAASGVDTVFLMGTPFELGTEAETEQGINGIEALKKAAPGHVILASVASADRNTGIPHFDSKFAVEKHLRSSGLAYTISAPVFFMDNLFAPWLLSSLRSGVLPHAMPANRPLQQIAVADIGKFAAILAERRGAVFGRRFDVAGDELTGEQAASVLSRASGRPITYQEVPLEIVRAQSADTEAMYAWFDRVGYSADIDGLRREFPEVGWQRYQEWANKVDWRVLAADSETVAA